MEKFRIWFERPLPSTLAHLLDGIAVSVNLPYESSKLLPDAMDDIHAIIASSRIEYNGALMDKFTELRVISRTGIGVDNISIADATARGIAICNAPDAPTISTAEHALMLMLATAKQLKRAERLLRRGETQDFFTVSNGLELRGLQLGLVGLGRIGSYVAKLALAFGMVVVAYDPYLSSNRASEVGVELASSLEALLHSADIVSLHVPLSEETRHLINAERLAQMKAGACLVNTARGGLVDETALLEALQSGRLHGAGLDVFDTEPPDPDNPLLNHEDVIATPHIAGVTVDSKERLWQVAIEQAIQVLQGERPLHLINPEVWPLDE